MMLGRLANQNYRQGLRLGMGASTLASRQQMHRFRAAAVAPNVESLNQQRMLNSYGAPTMQLQPLAAADYSMQPFLPRQRRPKQISGASPLAQWLMAQR